MLVVLSGFISFSQDALNREEWQVRVASAAESGGADAVLLLLNEPNAPKFMIYRNALRTLPENQRVASATEWIHEDTDRYYCLIDLLSPGKVRNDILLKYYQSKINLPLKYISRFNVNIATADECIAFYDAVLKNTALTDETREELGKIKGELLKLKAQ